MRNIETLKNLEIFQGFSDQDLARIIRGAKQMEYPPGGVIVRENASGGMLHIILEGQVEVRKKTSQENEKPLALLGEGAVFGEMSLFDGFPYSASVVAKENTSTLTMFRHDFESLAETDPGLAFKVSVNLINSLAGKLRKTNDNLITFAMLSRVETDIEKK